MLNALALKGDAASAIESVHGAVKRMMGPAQSGRHEVQLVEVGQRRFRVRQTVMSVENLPLIGRLLGHKRHRTTAGYAHLVDSHLAEAVEKLWALSMRR